MVVKCRTFLDFLILVGRVSTQCFCLTPNDFFSILECCWNKWFQIFSVVLNFCSGLFFIIVLVFGWSDFYYDFRYSIVDFLLLFTSDMLGCSKMQRLSSTGCFLCRQGVVFLTPHCFLTFMLLLDTKMFNWLFPLALDLLCSCLVSSVFFSLLIL